MTVGELDARLAGLHQSGRFDYWQEIPDDLPCGDLLQWLANKFTPPQEQKPEET